MRIGLLGLGNVAEQIHLPACAMLHDAEVVAACEPNRDRRVSIGRRFNIAGLYENPKGLFASEKLDIVIIATPPDSHSQLCRMALRHGAHVLCEKPFVSSIAEADTVIDCAERQKRLVIVNNQYRNMAVYRRSRERISRGDFGEPFLIQCWQQMFHPPAQEQNWRAELVQSTLYEFGTHPLDLICFFFGALPLSVAAHTPRPRSDIKTDLVIQMTLTFPGERVATLILNRASHALERYLEMRIDCELASLRLSFGGVARLAVDWSRVRGWPILRFSLVKGGEARVEVAGRSRVIARQWREARATATAANLRELITAIDSGVFTNDRARHARELIRIVEAGYESARTGETVWLNKP